jgi:hypothetical protein
VKHTIEKDNKRNIFYRKALKKCLNFDFKSS